jgi:hypothetical protein
MHILFIHQSGRDGRGRNEMENDMATEIATNENGPQAGKRPTHIAYSVRDR